MTLLSVLRNGDHRFLPLLLSKVHEVLPRLANPMLQTVPDNAACANIDIFDGFGNAGMGVPVQIPSQQSMGVQNALNEFKMEQGAINPRIEDLSSPGAESSDNHSSFMSPGIMTTTAEFPTMGDYGNFQQPDMSNPVMQAHGLPVGPSMNDNAGMGGDYKGLVMANARRPPMRANTTSGATFMHNMSRSVAEYHPHPLQRSNTDGVELGMQVGGVDMPYR